MKNIFLTSLLLAFGALSLCSFTTESVASTCEVRVNEYNSCTITTGTINTKRKTCAEARVAHIKRLIDAGVIQ